MSCVTSIANGRTAASCFFRSSVRHPYRKALLQITNRCNLHCAHCFVSAGAAGDDLSVAVITELVIPRLKECHVVRVTLTGGEPFVHPGIIEIARVFRHAGFPIGICTNGTAVTDEQMDALAAMGDVHLNVSLDGFGSESHGRFRGHLEAFERAVVTIRELGQRHLLQGILVTPNGLATVDEYELICGFAVECGAKYVLFNPLSAMGRGVVSRGTLAASREMMEEIRRVTLRFSQAIQVVYVRFPSNGMPLGRCGAGRIVYFFVHGEAAICPYLAFAARTPGSRYQPTDFIFGNVLTQADIQERLDQYSMRACHAAGSNPTCAVCRYAESCGRGCPAAVIAAGQSIGDVDVEVCPMAGGDVQG